MKARVDKDNEMESPVSYTRTAAESAHWRIRQIRDRNKPEVAVFIVQHLLPRDRWMWRRHEIKAAAFEGFVELMRADLATHWRIDDLYVVQSGLFSLPLEDIAMEFGGYSIEPTSDGGYWLRQYGWRVQYYRRRGMAVRRALRELGR